MVFFTTRCRMLVSRYENKGLVNYVEITKEFQRFFVRPPLKLYFRSNQNKSNESIRHSICFFAIPQFRKIPTPNFLIKRSLVL